MVPAWVGYDIGCTDKDTEYLSPAGWKKISEWRGEEILQYDLEKDTCSFATPKGYIKKPCKEFYHLDNGTVDQMVNDEHTMLLFSSKNKITPTIESAKFFIEKNKALKKGVNQLFKTTLPLETKKVLNLSNDEIALILAIVADGCIRPNGKVEFHLKKSRKINRLQSILERLGILFKTFNLKGDTWGCSFSWSKATKTLASFWEASVPQLHFIAEEVFFWDGHHRTEKGTKAFHSTNKESADLVQYACSVSGLRTNIHTVSYKDNHNQHWKTGYNVYTTKNSFVQFPKNKDIKVVPSPDGYCYCFTTKTGYWVMRRNGRMVITGNCGMISVKTNLTREDLQGKDLNKLHQQLHQFIPVGNSTHTESQGWHLTPSHTQQAEEIYHNRKGDYQLGTLGGGNHFLEVGYDEEDSIWVTIHSGSRGVGHGIAEYYMKLASGSDKAEEGHHSFDVDSKEGKDYILDLNFALEFALDNRKTMMSTALSVLSDFVEKYVNQEVFINRNHNHAELKAGLWIHRKGATHAEAGMLGVIPANMRDGVFIVEGKGAEESLCSSSHGAGRVLGRFKAKKVLNLEKFEKDMEGVVASVSKNTLDEAPDAYKDIFEVMRQQEDLVKVIAYVKPLVSVKG